MTPKNRIHELDIARGFCILCMVLVHLIYDLTEIYPVFKSPYPPFFTFVKEQGGIAFFLISGIAATLGHHPLRRGGQVFLCALVVSAVTGALGYLPIRFGVLHCLGLCMILWSIFQKLKSAVLLSLSAIFLILGAVFSRCMISAPFLYPLGLTRPDFLSADYFPLFPFFGFFLAGSCLGRKLYPNHRSLLPSLSSPAAHFLQFCGRHSLLLYLVHQPVLIFLIETVIFIGGAFHEI